MKEATGELNMTVVTVIAITAIGAIFYTLVWPRIQNSIDRNTNCANAFNCTSCSGGEMTCSYYGEDGGIVNNYSCPCSTDKSK